MAITYRGDSGSIVRGTTSPLTVGVSGMSVQSFDLGLLLSGTRATGGTTVTSTGFSLMDKTLNTVPTPDIQLHTLYAVLTAGMADPSVACSSPANAWGAMMAAYTGVSPSTPFDVTDTTQTGATTSVVAPSITTVTDNCMIVSILYSRQTSSVFTLGTANGFTLRAAYRTTEICIGIADKLSTTAGTYTGPTWTQGTTYDYAAQTLALRPGSPTVMAYRNRGMTRGYARGARSA